MKIKSSYASLFGTNLKWFVLVLALSLPMIFLFGIKSSSAIYPRPCPGCPVHPPMGVYYFITWHSQRVRLRLVKNVTVEKDRCHRYVGMGINFRTDNSYYMKLNGKNLKVWVDLRWPGFYVVHNGMQGPQPVYGTWLFKSLR